MPEDEEPGLLERTWNWVRRTACSIICAWKEILLWVLVCVAIAFLVWAVVNATIAIVSEAILTSWAGPGAWIVNIIIIVVWIVILILLAIGLSITYEWVWQRLKKKFWACWAAC